LSDVFLQTAGFALDSNVKSPVLGPQPPTAQAACLFVTQQEKIPIDYLVDGGMFVQFEIK